MQIYALEWTVRKIETEAKKKAMKQELMLTMQIHMLIFQFYRLNILSCYCRKTMRFTLKKQRQICYFSPSV